MQMASNDIHLETKHYRFLAMNLHSLKKEMFVAADLVLIKNFSSKNIDVYILRVSNEYCGIWLGIWNVFIW